MVENNIYGGRSGAVVENTNYGSLPRSAAFNPGYETESRSEPEYDYIPDGPQQPAAGGRVYGPPLDAAALGR